MEKEFNFIDDSEIGTSVSKLKFNNNKNIETDFDYDKILNNNSDIITNETNFNYDLVRNNMNNFNSTIIDVKPKKSINMSQFAKNVESDLIKVKNLNSYNYNEPLPVNYTKNIVQNSQLQKLENTFNLIPDINHNKKKETEKNLLQKSKHILHENKDIFIYILVFILLNNKFIIEFIYDKIPFVKKYNSPYPNLLIRSILFGLIIWAIKNFLSK
jgi:hypothetical protein